MAQYYYRNDKGLEAGPFNLTEIDALIAKGKMLPEYLARNGVDSDWKLAGQFAELDFAAPAEPSETPKGAGLAIVLCLLVPIITAILGLVNLGSETTKKQGLFYLRWSAISVLIWWAVMIAFR